MLWAADEVVPLDDAMLELEAPMRSAALRFERLPLFRRQLERGPVIDRRLMTGELSLAPALQFVGRFVAGIEPALSLEPFGGRAIGVEAFRLVLDAAGPDAEPIEISAIPSANSCVERSTSVSS